MSWAHEPRADAGRRGVPCGIDACVDGLPYGYSQPVPTRRERRPLLGTGLRRAGWPARVAERTVAFGGRGQRPPDRQGRALRHHRDGADRARRRSRVPRRSRAPQSTGRQGIRDPVWRRRDDARRSHPVYPDLIPRAGSAARSRPWGADFARLELSRANPALVVFTGHTQSSAGHQAGGAHARSGVRHYAGRSVGAAGRSS